MKEGACINTELSCGSSSLRIPLGNDVIGYTKGQIIIKVVQGEVVREVIDLIFLYHISVIFVFVLRT